MLNGGFAPGSSDSTYGNRSRKRSFGQVGEWIVIARLPGDARLRLAVPLIEHHGDQNGTT